jgi:hypothetical protein
MSHLGRYATGIKNANREVLKMALDYLVKLRAKDGAEAATAYKDFSGYEHKADFVYKDKQLSRGMSIFIDKDGELQFYGDPYGSEKHFNEVQTQFKQVYLAIAAVLSAKAHGFTNVQMQQTANGSIAIQLTD